MLISWYLCQIPAEWGRQTYHKSLEPWIFRSRERASWRCMGILLPDPTVSKSCYLRFSLVPNIRLFKVQMNRYYICSLTFCVSNFKYTSAFTLIISWDVSQYSKMAMKTEAIHVHQGYKVTWELLITETSCAENGRETQPWFPCFQVELLVAPKQL